MTFDLEGRFSGFFCFLISFTGSGTSSAFSCFAILRDDRAGTARRDLAFSFPAEVSETLEGMVASLMPKRSRDNESAQTR